MKIRTILTVAAAVFSMAAYARNTFTNRVYYNSRTGDILRIVRINDNLAISDHQMSYDLSTLEANWVRLVTGDSIDFLLNEQTFQNRSRAMRTIVGKAKALLYNGNPVAYISETPPMRPGDSDAIVFRGNEAGLKLFSEPEFAKLVDQIPFHDPLVFQAEVLVDPVTIADEQITESGETRTALMKLVDNIGQNPNNQKGLFNALSRAESLTRSPLASTLKNRYFLRSTSEPGPADLNEIGQELDPTAAVKAAEERR